MSDFLAIAASNKRVVHLVDWDRPCWFRADDPEGDRLIPGLDSIFTDAVLFFFSDEFKLSHDPFRNHRGKRKLIDANEYNDLQALNIARQEICKEKSTSILLAYYGHLDKLMQEDIMRHQTKILTAKID